VKPLFIIHGLPRSRTYWLSQWLGAAHDLSSTCDTAQNFVDRLLVARGTVETGSMAGWRLMKLAISDADIVTIRRPVADVLSSLAAVGITGVEEEIAAKDKHLNAMEAAGAMRIEFDQLSDARVCADLWEHLTAAPFDFARWRAFDAQNLQVNVSERLSMIQARASQIEQLTAEVEALTARLDAGETPAFLSIAAEPVARVWHDAESEGLAAEHYVEANAGWREHHPLRVNVALAVQLERAAGFRTYGARINGRLVGYLTWSISPDIESDGVLMADQGAFYVSQDQSLRKFQIGWKLLRHSEDDLKAIGVHSLQFHHPVHGRGARAGVMLRRLGATPNQNRYVKWIGA
jgi:hypothetical protein